MSKRSLILEIPTKDRGTLKYFAAVSAIKKLLSGEYAVTYFNPRSDFAKEVKHKA